MEATTNADIREARDEMECRYWTPLPAVIVIESLPSSANLSTRVEALQRVAKGLGVNLDRVFITPTPGQDQEGYRQLVNELPWVHQNGTYGSPSNGNYAFSFERSDKKVSLGIVGLNTAQREAAGAILAPSQLVEACGGDVGYFTAQHDANIVFTHASPNVMSGTSASAFSTSINPRGRFAAYICAFDGEESQREKVYGSKTTTILTLGRKGIACVGLSSLDDGIVRYTIESAQQTGDDRDVFTRSQHMRTSIRMLHPRPRGGDPAEDTAIDLGGKKYPFNEVRDALVRGYKEPFDAVATAIALRLPGHWRDAPGGSEELWHAVVASAVRYKQIANLANEAPRLRKNLPTEPGPITSSGSTTQKAKQAKFLTREGVVDLINTVLPLFDDLKAFALRLPKVRTLVYGSTSRAEINNILTEHLQPDQLLKALRTWAPQRYERATKGK